MKKFPLNRKKAFSLIELSIVIVIVSILITGVLSASVSGINSAKVKITNDRIKEIYNALGNYLVVNGRLPCPASITKTKTADSTYGNEIGTAGTCGDSDDTYISAGTGSDTDLIYGMIPFRTLGLPNEMGEDGFETKFTYIVDKNFTSATTFDTATSTSTMTVQEKPASVTQTATADAIFAIISHGANKAGGYPANSSAQNTRSSDADELENDMVVATSTTATFNATLVTSSGSSDSFDDIVFYKTRNQIIQDFSAFEAVNCAAASGVSETFCGGSVSTNWPVGVYNQEVISTTACAGNCDSGTTYPTKKCGAFGTWGSVIKPCIGP